MDGGSPEGDRKRRPVSGEPRVKRMMKTPAQLEALEKTYQVHKFPSETKRAELSAQLGLSDQQLQTWFCHRRGKDKNELSTKRQRKRSGASPPDGIPPPPPALVPVTKDELVIESVNEHDSGSGAGSSPYRHMEAQRDILPRLTGVAVARISPSYRYYDPPQPIEEHPAITLIEAQLGEPLREDGPTLGVEFDLLPPGAFGAPFDVAVAPQKQRGRGYEPNFYERLDAKVIKDPGRALHEYQFLPERPVRSDSCGRAQSPFYGSPSDSPSSRNVPLSTSHAYMHSIEELPLGYTLPAQMQSLSPMPHQGNKGHLLPSSGKHDGITHKSPLMSMVEDSPSSARPVLGMANALVSSYQCILNGDGVARVERKRKCEEAILDREAEACEKRTRKGLEKEVISRRKREEQVRKEMEKYDHEQRKEEERLLREKQREEERCQREQKREIEKREKLLQKESIRAEKIRQKEEIRKKKETAKQKAANDRAAARRIAKESMEPIEDERLELMEIAVSRKGLPSILSLDIETLENLDSFRDFMKSFPPQSVQLKRPFAIQPWADSDENVGNLLMVWRFLITFADVLGLWPFTVDEFLQAFHDYEPRLLGEIHIALLKSIVKDIEDVARAPSAGPGLNHSAANPGGGHPQLVEGAYAWGFDICSWQCHLNPLTWPEILRQFAFSAGFGPKLKKRNIEPAYVHDDNEDGDGADIISYLRSGAAVENAVAIMQERGYGNPRRSRHRLTPGTVKFAAFHVLSLEGRNGLNILEVATRIQKSGLRDLTTSKAPEASIATALSRDTKIFERVAPSTYCVRTPYRKDPADTEAILSAARERIRVFKSGFDGVEVDDVEKDDSSESDTTEGPEVDDLNNVMTVKDVAPCFGVSRSEVAISLDNGIRIGNDATFGDPGNGSEIGDVNLPLVQSRDIEEFTSVGDSVLRTVDFDGADEAVDIDQEDNDIDVSYPGEPWVQGLVEGEYSDLSVEERLNALVALIGVVIEGNNIRVVLEERLEAANALKKQMLAEAQVDKRRVKGEYLVKTQYTTISLSRLEAVTVAGTESRQSPVSALEGKVDEGSQNPMIQQTPIHDPQIYQKFHSDMLFERSSVTPDTLVSPNNLAFQQTGYTAERLRAQIKSYISQKAEEMYVYRSLPLGIDRRHNRYWQFMASASRNDPGCGRIFVELCNGGWRLIDSAEAFDALLASLDVRGVGESNLHALLLKVEPLFKEALKWKQLGATTGKQQKDAFEREASEATASFDPYTHSSCVINSPDSSICALNSGSPEVSSSFHVEYGNEKLDFVNAMKRYKDYADWMWKCCLSSSVLCAIKYGKKRCRQLLDMCDYCHDLYLFENNHCTVCHRTFSALEEKFSFSHHKSLCEESLKLNPNLRFLGLHDHYPTRITLLKALLALVEVSIPSEALQPLWSERNRRLWGMKLHMSASTDEILQVLTLLEGAVKRDFLSPEFQTTDELLASSKTSVSATDSTSDIGAAKVLPWLPQTTAAVTLRLMGLDSAVSYLLDHKPLSDKDSEAVDVMKLQSKYAVRNAQDELAGPRGQQLQEDIWMNPPGGCKTSSHVKAHGNGSGNGRCCGRARGGRSQRKAAGSRTEPRRKTSRTIAEQLGQVPGGLKKRSQGNGGRKRRRSVRSRKRPTKKVAAIGGQVHNLEQINIDRSFRTYVQGGWNAEQSTQMQTEDAVNDSDSERSGYGNDDNNGRGTGYGYDIPMNDYPDHADLLEGSCDNVDGGEEDVYENEEIEDDGCDEINRNDYQEDAGNNFDHDEDNYEDEVDASAAGYGGQRDFQIDGFFHMVSDDEGDEMEDAEGNANQDDDSGSSSTEYSD